VSQPDLQEILQQLRSGKTPSFKVLSKKETRNVHQESEMISMISDGDDDEEEEDLNDSNVRCSSYQQFSTEFDFNSKVIKDVNPKRSAVKSALRTCCQTAPHFCTK